MPSQLSNRPTAMVVLLIEAAATARSDQDFAPSRMPSPRISRPGASRSGWRDVDERDAVVIRR